MSILFTSANGVFGILSCKRSLRGESGSSMKLSGTQRPAVTPKSGLPVIFQQLELQPPRPFSRLTATGRRGGAPPAEGLHAACPRTASPR